jgi:hypothetical protein
LLRSLGDSLWATIRDLFRLGGPDERDRDTIPVELPWQHSWDWIAKRSAGPGFTRRDYREARERGVEVARATLGEELWKQLQQDGYLEVPSRHYPGVTYRLRVGRRIEVRCAEGTRSPWPYPYLCINPTYPMPDEEFLAQLYLYARDRESEIIRAAAPQPWDQPLGRTF